MKDEMTKFEMHLKCCPKVSLMTEDQQFPLHLTAFKIYGTFYWLPSLNLYCTGRLARIQEYSSSLRLF